tara:strand:+ start:386 stop:520 length:135 start_codon:yes stop_codon:yes gene_type:complete
MVTNAKIAKKIAKREALLCIIDSENRDKANNTEPKNLYCSFLTE